MKLNVIDPLGKTLHESLGITEDRASELSEHMDSIFDIEVAGSPNPSLAGILEQIVDVCDNVEEVTFCVWTHCRYQARKGVINAK